VRDSLGGGTGAEAAMAALMNAHSKLDAASSSGAGAEESGLVAALTDALHQLEQAIDKMAPGAAGGSPEASVTDVTPPPPPEVAKAERELLGDIQKQLQEQCDLFDRIGR